MTELFESSLDVGTCKELICPLDPFSTSRQSVTPASFSQQRLWFLDQLAPGISVYNLPNAWRITGALDVEALERSFASIVRRHQVLRTVFTPSANGVNQVVLHELTIQFVVTDFSLLPDIELRASVFLKEERERAFNLTKDALIRTGLIKLGEHDHILFVTVHHIIFDGWSIGVLMNELQALYQGQPESALPELSIQYSGYSERQHEWLQCTSYNKQLTYWKDYLETAPSIITLPTDRPRPKALTYRGAAVHFEIPPDTSLSLLALCKRLRATPFMMLVAAFNVLLHRHSGNDDLCIGYPVSGRNHPDIEGLIGFFVNTLVLRTKINGNSSFVALLHQVRASVLNNDAHKDMPFEKLVLELQPERTLNTNPLFQVMFSYVKTGNLTIEMPGIALQPIRTDSSTSHFDLGMEVAVIDDRLYGTLGYSTDLFDTSTIERMAGHFTTLVSDIVRRPEAQISQLEILTPQERHQLLVEWNDTQAAYPKDKCIHQLFEEQVEKTPNATAVIYEDQQLTYRQLNARANQLARYLREQGIQPDMLVAICVERSLEMVVGLLGILKAGGAYVPLDPEYPKDRLQFMLEDTNAPILLTQQPLIDQLPSYPGTVLCLDTQWTNIEQQPNSNPPNLTQPHHLAYCIYTSGSTGKPKGVILEHKNTANLICWAHTSTDHASFYNTLFSTSLNFDLSIYECFVPLTCGGTISLVRNATALAEEKTLITLINTVPSAIRVLIDANSIPATTGSINLAGEFLQQGLVARIFATTNVELIRNLYGPSETTTYSTCIEMDRNNDFIASIGRPISNTQVYILDRYSQPVPIGVAGEIYIGGVGVARGYLNRPELTAEKFLADPFGADSTARMYRTGDLGRYLPDGNIEFLGRIDHQVKLRGFRIELGEIEHALLSHEAISESVVIVREDVPGDKRLVAYLVVGGSASSPTVTELRTHLQKSLPEYMVPSTYVYLDKLPLTPNGKLDRKALPAPDASLVSLGTEYVAPRTPTEQMLADIWGDVLKVGRVGIHDNFFALGGHSLLALRILPHLKRLIDDRYSLSNFYRGPTIWKICSTNPFN